MNIYSWNPFGQRKRLAIRELYLSAIPYPLRKKVDAHLPLGFPQYYSQSPLLFMHIPKAAGTSIAQFLYGQSIAHLSADFLIRADSTAFNDKISFAISRNPWSRLYSAYKYAIAGGTARVPIESPNTYKSEGFSSFEKFVKDWLPRQKIECLDYVFQAQFKFISGPDGKILVNKLWKLEDLDNCLEWLNNYKNIEDFKSLNRLHDSSDYRVYFDNEMVDIVASLYEKDISLLGYNFG